MRNGIVDGTVPATHPFADAINRASTDYNFSSFLLAAIQHNETDALPDAATIVSQDGGHGVMQLTAAYPIDWADPYANIAYAIEFFLAPAEQYWAISEQGDDLVRCIAAEYNAGRGNAIAGHREGDVDKYTTNGYAARALAYYKELCA